MLNTYRSPVETLFLGKIMHGMRKMKAELMELRYCLERKVELRTGYLLKRIELLESCNATLSSKLALAQAKNQNIDSKEAEPNDRSAKLFEMEIALNLKDKWYDHTHSEHRLN